MQKYTDTVIKDGKPIQGLTVNVVNYPAGTPATIYSSTGSVVPSVQTDSNGRFEFYAPNGHYSFTVSGAGINPYTLNDIVLFDAADGGAQTVKTSGSISVEAVLGSKADSSALAAKAPLASPSFTGNVGVGTSAPQSALHVNAGDLILSNGGNVGGAGGQVGFTAIGTSNKPMAAIKGALQFVSGAEEQGALSFLTRPYNAGASSQLTEAARFDSTGNLLVGVTSGSSHAIRKTVSDGTTILSVTGGSGGTSVSVAGVDSSAGAANAAISALYLGRHSTTGRSLNAFGTVNASGADYAEYMTKVDACGTVAPGQIIGVDAGGKLTDKWVSAVSFLIKSTDPSYVGGDIWGTPGAIGLQPPVEPAFQVPPYNGFPQPSNTPPQQPQGISVTDAQRAAYESELAQYRADLGRFDREWTAYVTEVVAQRGQFETVTMGEYRADLAAFNAALEAARQKVDRIAYCGQVPVNVLGAQPGQYVVPVQDGEGIGAKLVSKSVMTLAQYMAAVGVVQNILRDGRANVRVKPV